MMKSRNIDNMIHSICFRGNCEISLNLAMLQLIHAHCKQLKNDSNLVEWDMSEKQNTTRICFETLR
ncbi:hypothetical protein NQ317_019459 [Molorchus minor]|uniref:Uncharacterized protein n=1 Tax=Molorchus minor TaxID=1323400 RepID=A0ABQ9IQQ7_9CUCU|nr:hypothetical protein NQ317_019459 [Molorchus minor]